ncbi:hypothetical protein D3C73_1604650 [compost metagenome]
MAGGKPAVPEHHPVPVHISGDSLPHLIAAACGIGDGQILGMKIIPADEEGL